jgi:hypothetical protein
MSDFAAHGAYHVNRFREGFVMAGNDRQQALPEHRQKASNFTSCCLRTRFVPLRTRCR